MQIENECCNNDQSVPVKWWPHIVSFFDGGVSKRQADVDDDDSHVILQTVGVLQRQHHLTGSGQGTYCAYTQDEHISTWALPQYTQ